MQRGRARLCARSALVVLAAHQTAVFVHQCKTTNCTFDKLDLIECRLPTPWQLHPKTTYRIFHLHGLRISSFEFKGRNPQSVKETTVMDTTGGMLLDRNPLWACQGCTSVGATKSRAFIFATKNCGRSRSLLFFSPPCELPNIAKRHPLFSSQGTSRREETT